MDTSIPLEHVAVIVAAVATGATITFCCSSWLARAWAKRWLNPAVDTQALRLRRMNLLFEKEYEAASALSALLNQHLPSYFHPAVSWKDACDSIACEFAKIDTALSFFLTQHSAALPEAAHKQLGEAIGLSREHRFKLSEPEVPASANKAAALVYEKLRKAEAELVKQVRGG